MYFYSISLDFYLMYLDFQTSTSSLLYATNVYGEKVFKNVYSAILRLHQG